MALLGAEAGFLRYWAKTGEGGTYHPVAYHGLDVAAAGLEVLARNPSLARRLAGLTGLEEEPLRHWLTFGLALHDLGKFADGFQGLDKELARRLQGRVTNRLYHPRHDTMGWVIWDEWVVPRLAEFGLVPTGADAVDVADLCSPWLLALTGHHGRPPGTQKFSAQLREQVGGQVERDLSTWLDTLRRQFLPAGLPFPVEPLDLREKAFKRASWWVAGLAVAADWIGSNRDWFDFEPPDRSLAEYWDEAQKRARTAVERAGLVATRPRAVAGFGALFADFAPTPLQRLADEIEFGTGPQLFVIEEVTGSGKTEAALTLAQRLVSAGRADGLYFALPTMATANAMHARVRALGDRFFAAGEPSSLILAHAKRRLALERLAATRTESGRAEYDRDEPTASRDCADWLARSGKSALLAAIGVGTIDQALLAVLQVRHQSLRLLGLAGKVLLVDEVHACDAYVGQLLQTLLRFHAASGGSAILLSATLPRKQRQAFVDAFVAELGGEGARELRSTDYPLVTQVTAGRSPTEVPVPARAEVSRSVAVDMMADEGAVDEALARLLEAGGCAAWIKNTVTEAIATYRRLARRFGPERVELFHARFTFGDRHGVETRVLERFGPSGTLEARRGRLLVATQVIEQSVDCDFDLLVTDLAPIDLVIQRAGRLQRHARSRPAGFEAPTLLVFGPEAVDEPAKDWYATKLPGGAFVYPNAAVLWRTARWLDAHGGFRMPEDARDMIESVYDPRDPSPAALERSEVRAVASGMTSKVVAAHNALKLVQGYQGTSLDWIDDIHPPTRLGDPTTTVRFAVAGPSGLVPFASDALFPWESSEVTVRQSKVGQDKAHAAEIAAASLTMPDQGRYVTVVVLEPAGAGKWTATTVNEEGRSLTLDYDRNEGVTFPPSR